MTFGSKQYVLFISVCFRCFHHYDKLVSRTKYSAVSFIHDNHFFHERFIQILYFDDSNIYETVNKYIEIHEKYREISKQNFEYHVQNEIIENHFNKFSQGKTKQEINELIKFTNKLYYCIKYDSVNYDMISLSEIFDYCDDDLKCKLNKGLSYSVSYGVKMNFADVAAKNLNDESLRNLRNFACSIFFDKQEQHCFSNFEEKIEYFKETMKLYSQQRQNYLKIISDFSQKQLEKKINADCCYTAKQFSPCVTLFDKIKIYFDLDLKGDIHCGDGVARFTFKSAVEKRNWLDCVIG